MWWLWVVIPLGVIVVGMGAAFLWAMPGWNEARGLTFADLDFTKISDGTYVGEYVGTKDSLRNCKVEVTVEGGRVQGVKILGGALCNAEQKTLGTSGLTIGTLFQRVIDEQSLQVDVVSGASLTSKVHLKAIENALASAATP